MRKIKSMKTYHSRDTTYKYEPENEQNRAPLKVVVKVNIVVLLS